MQGVALPVIPSVAEESFNRFAEDVEPYTERSGTSANVSPSISTESATSLGDLSPASFFISEATSFSGL